MYKWSDADGNVVYSDKKPVGSVSTQEFKRSSSDVSNEPDKNNLNSATEKASEQQKQDITDAFLNDQLNRDETIRKNCDIAKRNLETLTIQDAVYLQDDTGNPYLLSDKEKKTKTLDARSQIALYCTNDEAN